MPGIIERMSEQQPEPVPVDSDTDRWLQAIADQHHDGNRGRAAAAVLRAAYLADQAPDDRWADLDAQLASRRADGSTGS